MKKEFVFEDYIVEKSLKQCLREMFETGEEVRLENSMRRFDVFFTKDGKEYAVEYDGDGHYCRPNTIKSDHFKEEYCKERGIRLVRIPFFVQLTNDTFEYFFGFKSPINLVQDFPHGFISKRCPLPASFCRLGEERFLRELEELPTDVVNGIRESLIHKIEEHGRIYTITDPIGDALGI